MKERVESLFPLGLGKVENIYMSSTDEIDTVINGIKYFNKVCIIQAKIKYGNTIQPYEYIFLSSGDSNGFLTEKDTIYPLTVKSQYPMGNESVYTEFANMNLDEIKRKNLTVYKLAMRKALLSSHIITIK